MSYSNNTFDSVLENSSGLVLNYGFSIEKSENFILVLAMPYGISGKNTDKIIGASMALTILLI
ncbi:MAG: hypothetical protein U9N85_12645 [Bacteroidota bacterium]|nr:hypothetical protein [Bacteroidota bacterium]